MHASTILRRCLSPVFGTMHAARRSRLLVAVDALVRGRRLTLTDLARSWPGATYVHAPLKALDRLLSNRHLWRALEAIHAAVAGQVLAGRPSVLLVDWSDLKGDGRWCLLRAAVPAGGRALTVYEQVYSIKEINQPGAQARFLAELAHVLPAGVVPTLVTDAGFRSDWFRAVRERGWNFVGRVRNNTQARSVEEPAWQPCTHLYARARTSPRDLGDWELVKGHPTPCRLVTIKQRRKDRDKLTKNGHPEQGTVSKRSRKSAREPWLLATSLQETSAAGIVALYAKRMKIECAFRDLKSHKFGVAFEDSLSRKRDRLRVLLLLQTLASLAIWAMACAVRQLGAMLPDPLTRQASHRTRYSWHQRGRAWLLEVALPPPLEKWIRGLRTNAIHTGLGP